MSHLYLYALVDEAPSGPLGGGLAGEALRLVSCGEIAAVVGEQAERPRADRQTIERQDAVARRLAACFSAMLPARFGECLADEAVLRERLEPRVRELAEALGLVRGCVQMTLRVFGEPAPGEEAEPGGEGGPGTRYLAVRRREQERARALPEIESLREALRPLLRAERVERHASGLLLGTAYHLVRREEAGAYLAVLERAGERIDGHRVAASGPWPAYAFAPGVSP